MQQKSRQVHCWRALTNTQRASAKPGNGSSYAGPTGTAQPTRTSFSGVQQLYSVLFCRTSTTAGIVLVVFVCVFAVVVSLLAMLVQEVEFAQPCLAQAQTGWKRDCFLTQNGHCLTLASYKLTSILLVVIQRLCNHRAGSRCHFFSLFLKPKPGTTSHHNETPHKPCQQCLPKPLSLTPLSSSPMLRLKSLPTSSCR